MPAEASRLPWSVSWCLLVSSNFVLVISYSAVAFVLSDYALSRRGLGSGKRDPKGVTRLTQLGIHAVTFGALLMPLALLFGIAGVGFLVTVTLGHLLLDGALLLVDDRLEESPARRRAVSSSAEVGLSDGWAPYGALATIMQLLANAGLALVAWWIWLPATTMIDGPLGLIRVGGAVDLLAALTVASVAAALVLVNGYVGSRFVVSIMPPVSPAPGDDAAPDQEADTVSSIVGVLERTIVSALIIAHAEEAAALVLAAKEFARRRLVESDSRFAERYLIGTLASFAFAVLSGYLARVALESVV